MIDNDKDWFRSLTPYQVDQISRVLRPEQLAPFNSVVNRIADEDQEKAKKAEEEKQKLIQSAMRVINAEHEKQNMFKTWIRSITVEQMEVFSKTLDPQQYVPLMMVKQQILDEDEAQ